MYYLGKKSVMDSIPKRDVDTYLLAGKLKAQKWHKRKELL